MIELNLIKDLVEEHIVKGDLKWLANFNELHKDYELGGIIFPIYASGGLQEKGFLLSRIFSGLVTPKYKVHFFFYGSSELEPKFLKKMLLVFKKEFGVDDWIFLNLIQKHPFAEDLKQRITEFTDRNIGIAAHSLDAKEAISSDNTLGRNLLKNLRMTETKFEAFDLPDYFKSFTIAFCVGMVALVMIVFIGVQQALSNPLLTILFLVAFSMIVGHRIYKTQYHVTLLIDKAGFKLGRGRKIMEDKWSNYKDLTIYITSAHETYLRLYSEKGMVDLPLSRAGMSRKEAYDLIRQLIGK
ncbi:MAG: hypothetical protein ACUVQ8_08625 [Nitrososphaeria archaeon]